MEKERVAEAAGGSSSSMAAPRDAAYRDAPPQPQPLQHTQPQSHGHSRVSSMGAPEHQHGQSLRPPPESEMSHVMTRIEQQVAFNYQMIQAHNSDIARVSDNVGRLQHEMMQIINVMDEMRKDMLSGRIPPKAIDPARYDPADVEVLANQIANVTTKVNEVDNLKMQVDLLKQRLKRFEGAAGTPGAQPEGIVGRPDQQHYELVRAKQLHQPPGQPQPPIRPGAAVSSEHSRQPGHPPVLESQPSFHSTHERQAVTTEQAQQANRQPGFRPADALPPPTALSGWRPAESLPPPGGPPTAHSHPLRSHPPESEPQPSGWAAVNAKRPLDEHHPQHDSSQPGSPKRPKLAPLKPRNSFGDDHHQSPYAQPAHIEAAQARGRLPSGDLQFQPHSQANPAPASGQGAGNSYRFITSTGQPDSQEHWRSAEGDSIAGSRFDQGTTGTGRGRGRGSRGGRRGGRGRGGRSSSGAADIPTPAPDIPPEHVHTIQVPPEWREHQWTATQHPGSNGHYPGQHSFSPIDAARQPLPELAVHTGAPPHGLSYPAGHEHEFPATPIASNADPYSMANDLDSANRKTRTKPIRNSDGVLIRKDGRPDMRSVSSANNLRKVHAKKEAEKAEMEGRTPTSGRSLAPANSSSLSDDEGMEEGDYMELEGEMERERSEGRNGTPSTQHEADLPESLVRHRELMSRMFNESSTRSKGMAEAWFPRAAEGPPLDVKREDHENKEREARWRGMEDTMMRESEAGGEREMSRQASEQVSRRASEQVSRLTSLEATPSNAVVSEPAASEQPESEVEPAVASAPDSAPLSATGEKEAGKKDSTQLEASVERVPSEHAVADQAAA